ncbi:MAG: peptide-N-glycosidase F-related protein, partial [Bacteroidales bacterium]|nr:peptide-N-glycosidase F-related protein [Bacteroidales bacterium]
LYVNGNMVGSSSASGTFSNPGVPFGIGKSLLGGFNFVFGGGIDEVSVWNVALEQSDVQDIIDNELSGDEPGLQMYYKFNQGEPGGNNTSITHLFDAVESPERDAELMNFALTGETSNFLGELDPGYQAIAFPQIPTHLTTDAPFQLEATATSGLPVEYEVISGPATVAGDICTLTGSPGEVVIEATQPGNATYNPAEPVQVAFMVVDPAANTPNIDPRNPLAGDVYMPETGYLQLAAFVDIDYPDIFEVDGVTFTVDGGTLDPTDWGEGYFSGWWEVPDYGTYTITIYATNNYGYTGSETVIVNIVSDVVEQEVHAVDDVWLNTANSSEVVDAVLPSYTGAYGEITATLELSCPPGGCGEWDRVASIDARGHNGEWVEIIRYITPYGTPCSHTIDLTDYMSILQGKVSFRLNCGTLDNGYYWDLTLNFVEGTPAFFYSNIDVIWWETYQFGDYANLQPVENVVYTFPDNAQDARMKLVSTGHAWGDLNTGNAAEFYNATHHVWVNGEETFEQHNWYTCNPNPDGCQPQNGTWYHNRAGWCPGAIAQWFDYEFGSYIPDETIALDYMFYENYVDLCHPNHPECVTGVTCDDCEDTYNPHLIVACNMVVYSDMPIDGGNLVSLEEFEGLLSGYIKLYPNPTDGMMTLEYSGPGELDATRITVLDITGKAYDGFEWHGETRSLNLSALADGIYFVKIENEDGMDVRKIVVQ